MILAALLDAGCPLEPVEDAVRSCGVDVRLGLDEVRRAGLRAARLRIDGEQEGTDRRLPDLLDAVRASSLRDEARERAVAILDALGRTEADLHGVAAQDVHLHELTGVDTLVDVVGTCASLDLLGVDRLHAGPVPAGPGSVETEHGLLPLPAPATLRLLAAAHAPLIPGAPDVEHVTPTAAAILATLARFETPAMRLRRVGHGAGARDDARRPNVLRCWLGEPLPLVAGASLEPAFDDACVELRTNLDDASPAVLAGLAARCLEAGALDAWIVGATMKKGRPGHVLHVLVPAGGETAVAAMLLAESPTLGVRRTDAARMVAARDSVEIATPFGAVTVKRKVLGGRVVDAQPEHDDCVRVAREHGMALHRVVAELTALARAELVTKDKT